MAEKYAESFYFYHNPGAYSYKNSGTVHDPLLGWYPAKTREPFPPLPFSVSHSSKYFPETDRVEKPRGIKRIVLVGNSFIYGTVTEEKDTISAFLSKHLGKEFQIINLGAHAYGLDQELITAVEVAPRYLPDLIIVGFSIDDLDRGCVDFRFNAKKPVFDLKGGKLELQGVPVPTPEQVTEKHEPFLQRSADFFITKLMMSRVVTLVAQAFLQPERTRCLNELNPAILEWGTQELKEKGIVPLMARVDDWRVMPEAFRAKIESLGVSYLDLPAVRPRYAEKLHLKPEHLPDGHPAGPLNEIYGAAIADSVRKVFSKN